MKFNAEKPHNDLTLIPPAIELETKEILKQALKSHKILAELKGFAEMLPEKKDHNQFDNALRSERQFRN